jgi:ABC-type amino acid transport substrate-binding protein
MSQCPGLAVLARPRQERDLLPERERAFERTQRGRQVRPLPVGVRKNDNQLKQRLNAAIKAVHDSGEYSAITKKYFAFDIWPK